MKTKIVAKLAGCSLLLSTLNLQLSTLFAQGTAFTYQGRLNDGANPAAGIYDLRFTIYDSTNLPGIVVAGPLTNSATGVSNGLFTVTFDFGAGVFIGPDRWLEIGVRTNGGGAFASLSPRQKIAPSPYAITAVNLAGVVANNTVNSALFATVGGGFGNTSIGLDATVGGGYQNTNVGPYATIAGGYRNFGSGSYSTVAGGAQNTNTGAFATVSGGLLNTSSSDYSTVGGGDRNSASVMGATVDGGFFNLASGPGAFVGGGGGDGSAFAGNIASGGASVVVGGISNRASGITAFIGGGGNDGFEVVGNIATGDASVIGGGVGNYALGLDTTVGGGLFNTNDADESVIGGGYKNTVSDQPGIMNGGCTIAGGSFNLATNDWGTIPGGYFNVAGGYGSFAAGGNARALHDGTFVWNDGLVNPFASTTNYQFLVHASHGVGINATHTLRTLQVGDSTINGTEGMIHLASRSSTGSSILRNWECGVPQTADNLSGDGYCFVIRDVDAAADRMVIRYSSGNVGIGTASPATALHVRAPSDVEVSIESSDPGGRRYTLQSSDDHSGVLSGSFQIIDRTLGFARVVVLTNGDVGIGTSAPTNQLQVAGSVAATAFVTVSDRNAKENFAPVSPDAVLAKVLALPITTWNFKELHDGRHMGPMAQDFYATFGLGGSDSTITSVDPAGVTLAAIQGLNRKVEEQSAELKQKETEITKLQQRLDTLERTIRNLKSN